MGIDMKKKILSAGKDYTHMLAGFKEVILKSGIRKNGCLIFAGCPGPCYSMATFFSFGIRDLGLNLFFAVNADLDQLWRLEFDQNRGITATSKENPFKAEGVVLMSGLCSIPIEKTIDFLKEGLTEDGVIIGEAPAPGFFEEKGWDKKIRFNFFFEFSMHNPTSFEVDY